MFQRNQKQNSSFEGLKFLSAMADPDQEQTPLPRSVEEMLQRICKEQCLPPPDNQARRQLSLLGEQGSLRLLQRVTNLSDYISYTARASSSSSVAVTQESVNFSGLERSESSVSQPRKDDAILDCLSAEEQNGYSDLPYSTMHKREENLNTSNVEKPRRPTSSPQRLFLSELEFNKAFIILCYCGRMKLEDVATVDTIRRLKDVPMILFESEVWRAFGYQCIEETDRAKNIDWGSERTFMYHCHVDSDGSYAFKGPYLQKGKTHLQRVLGDENVLVVKFSEEAAGNSSALRCNDSFAAYKRIARDGIFLGLRCYKFFVFKDGGKEEKKKSPTSSPVKCYFVCMGSSAPSDMEMPPCILFNKSICEARSVFMHIHRISSMAKYMARFSLILSKTLKLEIDLASVRIERIEDKPCLDEYGQVVYNGDGEARIHTDGTGFISEDLALKCPRNISRGCYLSNGDIERILNRIALEDKSLKFERAKAHIGEPPCLIQVRLFNNGCAVKGTLLINRMLPPGTIQIRPSMIKVETDLKLSYAQAANSLEIVSTSNQPRKTSYLSRYLIALLTYGGVRKEYFLELLENALEVARNVHYDTRAALTVAIKYGQMDDFLVPRMLVCGIPLDEPYLHHRLSILMKEERKGLKGGKVPISECYYLMGTSDPTGVLKLDEVCVILEDGQISGDVLVYKHPGLHFGDIHKLKATYVKDMENIVGNAKYAIFFSTKGPRSLADEIANSDFDGDMYWVSRNPQLVDGFTAGEPWVPTYSSKSASNRKPSQFTSEELETELFEQFLTCRFHPSSCMGIAADSWLAFMDRILTLGSECGEEIECVKEKMLQLIDIYYDALDAPKTGKKVEVPKYLRADKFPHFMERSQSYCSKSILGLIYDQVESFRTAEVHTKDVWKLPYLSGEVPEACLRLWKARYEQYRVEMSHAMHLGDDLKEASASEIIVKYKQMLYNAAEIDESTRSREDIFNEALAIYNVTYDYAKNSGVSKCGFAWKVAGRALCELYVLEQDEEPIICSKSFLREIIN